MVQSRSSRATKLVASSLTLTLVSDAVLYLLLPVYFGEFSLSLVWVGILLSANRFVRILLNPWLGGQHARLGNRKATIVAVLFASLASGMFLLFSGPWLLLAARLLWGVAYAFMRLSCLYYATEHPDHRLKNMGWYSVIQEIGPLLVLLAAPWFVESLSVHSVILLSFCLCLGAFVPAFMLPRDSASAIVRQTSLLPEISPAQGLTFLSCLLLDGLWMLVLSPLLVLGGRSEAEAIAVAAALVVGKRLFNLLLGLLAIRLGHLAHTNVLLTAATALMFVATALLASDWLLTASILGIVGHGVFMMLMPKWLTDQSPDRHRQQQVLNAFTFWRDAAAAAGALLGGGLLVAGKTNIAFAFGAILLSLLWLYWQLSRIEGKTVKPVCESTQIR
ncbi:MFS transporter [Microbulbifer marinus]|uniref:Na+/melibiose symporter n=1 Tax=Microbulbifer marinus TaxID=658218 RepID=A0A1H3Z3R1_9GAMM|nr:MFS transporter [Microbulbifer marinus]SEA18296.1 Na+/melibiose symporter [Microbulbifer marinus]